MPLRLLSYPSQDPYETRRRTLFNILLIGVSIPVLGLLIINLYVTVTRANPDAPLFLVLDVAAVGALIALYFLHRLRPNLARHVFLLFLTLTTMTFFEISTLDRVLVVLTIPVLMAAFLFRPSSSFVYAVVVSLAYVITLLLASTSLRWEYETLIDAFNYFSVMSYFALALVVWVVSRSLDQALTEAQRRAEELHAFNEELDQRVQDRTRELARALEREHAMAVRNQTILESIGDGVLVTDSSGRIILSNPAADQLAHQEKLEAMLLEEAMAGVRPEVLNQLGAQMAGKEEERHNIRFKWNQRTVAANVSPIRLDLPGQTHLSGGNVTVLRDVTREAELDRMKTIFLGSVSHELRTPISAIKGFVDLLSDLEAESLSDTGREYLGIVSANIRRLLSLANDLIDLSRIEVGEIALYREWTELEPLVEGAVDTVRQEYEKRGLDLQVQIETGLPLLFLDRHRITQVLLNLLTNAYKYTVEGGGSLRVSQTDHTVQIEIGDTGVGMTGKEQAHLFERFFRSNHEVVQKAGGSGLGLTIAKSMVELHGGKISVQSEYNVGTTFTVSLPLEEVPEPA
jgi:signal transduction histidine kinase